MNERHLNTVFPAKINWPNKTNSKDLLPYVLLRIPGSFIFLYDTLNIKAFFRRQSGKIFEGNYMMVADLEKMSFYCVDFEIHEAESKWQTGWHANTDYPIKRNENFGNPIFLETHDLTDFILADDLKSKPNYGLRKRDTLAKLEKVLREAESLEDYETCIKLRDEIIKRKAAK